MRQIMKDRKIKQEKRKCERKKKRERRREGLEQWFSTDVRELPPVVFSLLLLLIFVEKRRSTYSH